MRVDPWTDRIGGLIERHPGLVRGIADLETRLLGETLADIAVERPVYIAGLARSGSTILLELLARHPDLATHRYRDFPGVLMPLTWNWFVDRAAAAAPRPAAERAHGDRIAVTPESPEAYEELVWMAYFEDAHAPGRSAVLDGRARHADFDAFYRSHIAKILHLRQRSRYLAKGNYNLTRLGYLKALFPEARFLAPVRDPVWHVASLMKQHGLFREAEAADPAVLRSMRRSGHFEFGLDRRIVSVGRTEAERRIEALWAEGREAAGWAAYWALLHDWLLDTLAGDPALAAATLVVRYEDLCADPAAEMRRVLAHCHLSEADLPALAASTVSAPEYYRPRFSEQESAGIEAETGRTASRLGYATRPAPSGAAAKGLARTGGMPIW